MSDRSIERKLLQALLCVIVFAGAWLLFQIEPLSGKIITPRFGGTANVWIVCLLFFQIVVLAGYLLTFVVAKLPLRVQVIAYVILVGVSLKWTSIPGIDGWSFSDDGDPTLMLLSELTSRLSVPCIILSSISGTMQVWCAMARFANPYLLYSLSNLGSFGALVAYPTLIEPALRVSASLSAWQVVYQFLFGAIVVAAVLVLRRLGSAAIPEDTQASVPTSVSPLTPARFAYWLFLSTLGSAGLLAFSSHITSDVAPVPLLWVLPLAIYLLTFVIAFARSKEINKNLILVSWVPLVVAEPICLLFSASMASVLNLILLFEMCLILNCELADTKPPADRLPAFYLAMAAGGALGGILVGLVAPVVFTFSGERLVCILVFTIYQFFTDIGSLNKKRLILRTVIAALMLGTLVVWLIVPLPDVLHRERNFFGSVSVKREQGYRVMYNGRVNHGQQFEDPAKADVNASPYGQPVALTIACLRSTRNATPIAVGVIGLGAGAVAAEGRAGDAFTFYELDPKTVRMAQEWFTYLSRCKANIDVQVGDGRLLLDKSKDKYDLISVDAFNGDAIPVHLLTTEAMEIYLAHLKQGGLVIFNVTNVYLDVAPVVACLAEKLHLHGCLLTFDKTVKYVVIGADPHAIDELQVFASKERSRFGGTVASPLPRRPDLRAWTDDYSNLFSILRLSN